MCVADERVLRFFGYSSHEPKPILTRPNIFDYNELTYEDIPGADQSHPNILKFMQKDLDDSTKRIGYQLAPFASSAFFCVCSKNIFGFLAAIPSTCVCLAEGESIVFDDLAAERVTVFTVFLKIISPEVQSGAPNISGTSKRLFEDDSHPASKKFRPNEEPTTDIKETDGLQHNVSYCSTETEEYDIVVTRRSTGRDKPGAIILRCSSNTCLALSGTAIRDFQNARVNKGKLCAWIFPNI